MDVRFVVLVLSAALFSLNTNAAPIQALAKKATKVYAAPSETSKLLARFKKVGKVTVLGKRGLWYKVKLTLGRGKYLEGWTLKTNLFRPKPTKVVKPKQKEDKKFNLVKDRLDITVNLGSRINSYSIADTTNRIAYDLPGIFVSLELFYEVIKLVKFPATFGIQTIYEFEVKPYTFEILDDSSPATEISSSTSTGKVNVFDFSIFSLIRLKDDENSPQLLLHLGYLLSFSSLDDGELRNLPVNLFTNGDYTHGYVGGGFIIPFRVNELDLGFRSTAKAFLINDYEESTEAGATNVSGQDPSANFGYQIEAGFFWRLMEHVILHAKFIRKDEGADFTGAGERLVNTSEVVSFQNATISDSYNGGLVGISYDF